MRQKVVNNVYELHFICEHNSFNKCTTVRADFCILCLFTYCRFKGHYFGQRKCALVICFAIEWHYLYNLSLVSVCIFMRYIKMSLLYLPYKIHTHTRCLVSQYVETYFKQCNDNIILQQVQRVFF